MIELLNVRKWVGYILTMSFHFSFVLPALAAQLYLTLMRESVTYPAEMIRS